MYGEGMADKAQNGSPKRDEVEDASSSFAWHGVRFGPSLSVVAFRCVAAISYAAPISIVPRAMAYRIAAQMGSSK
jgi:hypothetical protein